MALSKVCVERFYNYTASKQPQIYTLLWPTKNLIFTIATLGLVMSSYNVLVIAKIFTFAFLMGHDKLLAFNHDIVACLLQ